MAELIIEAIIFVFSFLLGNQIHERYHFWTGKFFGTDPQYGGKFTPIFPTSTEFRNRDNLTSKQIRVVSIPGHVFWIVLLILALWPEFPVYHSDVALVGVVAGGSLISWTDGLAAKSPEIWLKFNEWMDSEDSLT